MQVAPEALDSSSVLAALRALKKGDFSVRLPTNLYGLDGEIAATFNDIAELNAALTNEYARIRHAVGKQGRISERVRQQGAAGAWAERIESVNQIIADLVWPTREIARVIESVARGDLAPRMLTEIDGIPLEGEFLHIGRVVNTMVDQLNAFTSEVSRVAREVGTEGKLGGQAQVPGVAGTWKDLTDNVNSMAENLTGQVRNIAEVTTAVARGDLTKKITVDVKGEILVLKSTINTMVDQLNGFASEVSRVSREVGTEGKLGGQAHVPGVAGTWKDLTDNVNSMAENLTGQVRNIAEVTTAVAKGDLTKKITVDVQGEILALKSTINTMVDQLNGFASEVSRVAREVGAEGKLGGQAEVPDAAGTWQDLTRNVNSMAANLTNQVRGIAQVVTAVADGDLKHKVVFEAKGEIAALADTINNMIDTLATFGDQVTNVARDVGIDGKLGGQARVPGAAGVWRDLTNNVNQLAANLTSQVRAIAEVATAVTKGDLTRSIMVEAMGEVAVLKDTINEMIRNLADTTRQNNDQDWLKTNLAKFSRMLQGQSDLVTVSKLVLSQLAPLINAQQGVLYIKTEGDGGVPCLQQLASYASTTNRNLPKTLRLGQGLLGQCALEKKRISLLDIPDSNIRIASLLGTVKPTSIMVLPVLFEGEVRAVVELASIGKFSDISLTFLDQLMETIGIVFNTIEANMRTQELLAQSQSLTKELQSQQEELRETNERLAHQAENLRNSERLLKSQQEELRRTNEQLEIKAGLLSEQMSQVEFKNREVEQARAALEEKAEQLAMSSRYKSEFLANMSHELRTPLNSLLILAKLLAEHGGSNLTPKQIEYAQTIYAAGTDLLSLINDILDLAKIESGTVTLDIVPVRFAAVREYVERTFRQIAQGKALRFTIEVDPALPTSMHSDDKRLQQVLKNLLSNAFKFTERGEVALDIYVAKSGWTPGQRHLDRARTVVAFAVKDTGIGIPENARRIIFEAFQQADGTTSRKFGGTGLGLSISRELTRRLGGEIRVDSVPGAGSTFTLYLPLTDAPGLDPGLAAPVPRADRFTPMFPDRFERNRHVRADDPLQATVKHTDDRAIIRAGDLIALIVDADAGFAGGLLTLARESGFKGIVALDATSAMRLVREQQPHVITLDLKLPDADGCAILDLLKHDPETRHIPICVISADERAQKCLAMGALAVVRKPGDDDLLKGALRRARAVNERAARTVLIAGATPEERAALAGVLADVAGIRTVVADSGNAVLESLSVLQPDCVVLGMSLADMSIVSLLENVAAPDNGDAVPLVVYGTEALGLDEQNAIRSFAESVALKCAPTIEAVLAEMTLFLHMPLADLPSEKRQLLAEMYRAFHGLSGKKILIIDDDIRNIFALTGAMEEYGMTVLNAEGGMAGLELLSRAPDIDAVLVDIMMPEIDGYETIRMIREIERYKGVPIVAVTARAMKGDREKCIEAGASDYVAKPVNIEQLRSLLRVWLAI